MQRFAAKEATSKALGTGISNGIFWREIEVINLPSGKPIVNLYSKAKKRLESMLPKIWQQIFLLVLLMKESMLKPLL